jgi:Flp pilus assembly protein protease CpaA
MGGGDVKLFAALGALTSFDIRIGLEIQICAFVCAMCLALSRLLWTGQLRSTIGSAIDRVLRSTRLRPHGCRVAQPMTPHKLGVAILVSTLIQCGPQVADAWSGR